MMSSCQLCCADCKLQEAAKLYLFGGHSVEIAADKSEKETVFNDLWQLDLKTYQVSAGRAIPTSCEGTNADHVAG